MGLKEPYLSRRLRVSAFTVGVFVILVAVIGALAFLYFRNNTDLTNSSHPTRQPTVTITESPSVTTNREEYISEFDLTVSFPDKYGFNRVEHTRSCTFISEFIRVNGCNDVINDTFDVLEVFIELPNSTNPDGHSNSLGLIGTVFQGGACDGEYRKRSMVIEGSEHSLTLCYSESEQAIIGTSDPVKLSANADYTDMFIYIYAEDEEVLQELLNIAEEID